MSIRNTYPTIRPSLNLDFARSRTLDPRITFSRTTTGTYMDSDGLIKIASADEARFDHRYVNGQLESLGLLVEESRVNYARLSGRPDANWILDVSGGNGLSFIDGEIVTSSSGGLSATYIAELSTSSQIVTKLSSGYPAGVLTGQTSGATRNIGTVLSPGGATNVSATLTNEVVSPDGTQNAYIISPTTTGTQLRLVSKTYVTSTAGTYTFSIFFKNKNLSSNTVAIRLANQDATAHVRLNFNFATKTFSGTDNSGLGGWTGTYGYQDYPNDWIRIWVTATTTAGSHTFISGNFWLGGYQGTAETIGSLYLWESQIEQGAFPTSQIKTTLSTATRNPDNVSMEGDNFSDWYNPTEGTIVLDCTPVYDNSSNQYRRLVSIHNNSGSQTDVIQFIQTEATNQVSSAVWDGSSFQTGFGKTLLSGTRYKVAFAVKENNMNASYDGSIGTDDTSATLPVMTEMDIGSYTQFSSTRATAHYNSLRYYPRRLSNSELQNLTK